MKRTKKSHRRITSLLLSVLIMLAFMPAAAFAETDDQAGGGTVRMIAGEMLSGFEGYTSKDPTVAWVDGNGRLCAMKEGETTVTTATESGTITRKVSVSRYDDGSPVVGRLKILARYNDQMQFYDGHAYLLFTSYRDGVKVSVTIFMPAMRSPTVTIRTSMLTSLQVPITQARIPTSISPTEMT